MGYLQHIDGFDDLMSVGGSLYVTENVFMEGIDGFESLASTGLDMVLRNNVALSCVGKFNSLTSIGGNFKVVTSSLSDLCAFSSVATVDGDSAEVCANINFNGATETPEALLDQLNGKDHCSFSVPFFGNDICLVHCWSVFNPLVASDCSTVSACPNFRPTQSPETKKTKKKDSKTKKKKGSKRKKQKGGEVLPNVAALKNAQLSGSRSSSSNAVVGGAAAAAVLLSCIALVALYRRRKRLRNTYATTEVTPLAP